MVVSYLRVVAFNNYHHKTPIDTQSDVLQMLKYCIYLFKVFFNIEKIFQLKENNVKYNFNLNRDLTFDQ